MFGLQVSRKKIELLCQESVLDFLPNMTTVSPAGKQTGSTEIRVANVFLIKAMFLSFPEACVSWVHVLNEILTL